MRGFTSSKELTQKAALISSSVDLPGTRREEASGNSSRVCRGTHPKMRRASRYSQWSLTPRRLWRSFCFKRFPLRASPAAAVLTPRWRSSLA
jgi:hypothetical protein